MDQQQMLMMLPDLQPDELLMIQNLTKDMNDNQQRQFYLLYKSKRKEKKDLLILTILGFFGVAGIQRFVIGEIGMGILYLLTIGFCGIGTIIDVVNLDSMVSRFNQNQAMETANMVRMMSNNPQRY